MSFGKRVDGFAGRRSEPRAEVMFPASATTMSWSKAVLVMDICTTGARLSAAGLPRCGTDMLLKIGELDVLATVLWSSEDQCGVRFEEPISSDEIDQLEDEGRWAVASNLTPDERLAIAHCAIALPRRRRGRGGRSSGGA